MSKHKTLNQKIKSQLRRLETRVKEQQKSRITPDFEESNLILKSTFKTPGISLVLSNFSETQNSPSNYAYVFSDLRKMFFITLTAFVFEAVLYLGLEKGYFNLLKNLFSGR